jgi:hypothetical protein
MPPKHCSLKAKREVVVPGNRVLVLQAGKELKIC